MKNKLLIVLGGIVLSLLFYNCPPDKPPATDSDNDGVADNVDKCPNTPSNASVDANGCSQGQRDDDKDGVANSVDKCPNTPANEQADATGCSLSQKISDDDNDGIANSVDKCPNTPSNEKADASGCSPSQKQGTSIIIDKSSGTYAINKFVWRGLNYYYFWVDDVKNLDSATFSNSADKLDSNLLLTYSKPDQLYRNLLNKWLEVDKYSLIYDNYTNLENSLGRIALKAGVSFGFFPYKSNVRGFVRYVIPGFSAANQGLKRGDVFTHVDGTMMTRSNYINLVNKNTYEITLTDDKKITITKITKSEPSVFRKKVFNEGGKKIGYMVLNSFLSGYESDLNDTLGYFKDQGINELVLDLRYNGGGLVTMAQMLASSIAGQANVGKACIKYKYNDALAKEYEGQDDYFTTNFMDKVPDTETPINFLNLSRVYILVTRVTASASELIINSLKPYMTVTLIGKNTNGKNVGSITLYDSDNFMKDHASLNASHKWAMQPIIFEIANSQNFSDYGKGFTVDENINELDYLSQHGSLPALGDKADLLLAKALSLITGNASASASSSNLHFYHRSMQEIYDDRLLAPFENDMYMDLKDLPAGFRKSIQRKLKRK